MNKRVGANREGDSRTPAIELILGSSTDMKRLIEDINIEASHCGHVIILGETGTGKELVAKALHEEGFKAKQHGEKFEAVSCATFVGDGNAAETALFGYVKGAYTGAGKGRDGLIAQAGDGVLFLDDIQDLPESVAAKLNRTIIDHTYRKFGSDEVELRRCRIIAASNAAEDTGDGRKFGLRRDFVERFKGRIMISPLRVRRQDAVELFFQFHDKARKDAGLEPVKDVPLSVAASLLMYNWPGNVRELENSVESLVREEKSSPKRVNEYVTGQKHFWRLPAGVFYEKLVGLAASGAFRVPLGPRVWIQGVWISRESLMEFVGGEDYKWAVWHGPEDVDGKCQTWLFERVVEFEDRLSDYVLSGKLPANVYADMKEEGRNFWKIAKSLGFEVVLGDPEGTITSARQASNVRVSERDPLEVVLDECGWRFDRLERMYFEKMLEHCGRNIAEVARRSGVSDQRWRRRLKKWGRESAVRGDLRK